MSDDVPEDCSNADQFDFVCIEMTINNYIEHNKGFVLFLFARYHL